MGDISANGADIGAVELETGHVAQFIETKPAIDDKLVFVDLLKLFRLGIEFVLDIADQFLEHVLHRDHADSAAELIDHDGEMSVPDQKEIEQFFQRHHFRNRNEFPPDFHQVRMRIAHQRNEFLDVDQSDGVVEMPAAKRKSRVPRIERFLDVALEILLEIEVNHFAARRHDVAHNATPKV